MKIDREIQQKRDEYYKITIHILGMSLEMDFKRYEVNAHDVFNIVKAVNNSWDDDHPKKIKRIELGKLLKMPAVKEMIDSIDSDFNEAALRAAGTSPLPARTSRLAAQKTAVTKIGKKTYIHPWVALDILGYFSVELRKEIYRVFTEQKILEKRSSSNDAYANFQWLAYTTRRGIGVPELRAQKDTDAMMRMLSNDLNAKLGIPTIQDENIHPDVHESRARMFEILYDILEEKRNLSMDDVNTAYMAAGFKRIHNIYRT